ncbi:hypothetical protein DFO73_110190 [Cytobacillus oceanisediminis]|uniref:Uncharacterized protein n=1 Tax=Cytobacillus oceanisediminis TaxID=665099 RepID=A0A2V2ZQM9_9BACI|nr:hypothetical protein [Cytobacillus oceanisediminis]PWW26616.1 hypothetical protein DFO73_110190 [Cytobacillus oceanisediminis]
MFIYQLVKEYKKRFGFKNILLRNVKMNKWILFYLLTSVCFPIIISILFYFDLIIWMVLSIVVYFIILYFGGEQHKKKMIKLKPTNTLGYDVQPFRKMLSEIFSITSDEQLLRLDEIIKREISAVEYNRKYPLSDIIRQLFVALLITGLLSYAFFEIRDGNTEKATPLLAAYILVIGFTITLSGFLKQIREFGSSSYLNDISFLIHLSLLEVSIQTNPKQELEEDNYHLVLPSRKDKHK